MKLLHLQVALARFGWLNCVALALLLAGVAAWFWGIAYLRAQTNAPQRALQQAQQALKAGNQDAGASAASMPQQRLLAYYDLLGEQRHAEQQIKTLFAVADKTGLSLSQAEYKSAWDQAGRTHTYQMILPIKGSYPAIRRFCEQVLLAIPFAALDEISFKREAIGNTTLEAKLHFTLYLADAAARNPQEQARSDAK